MHSFHKHTKTNPLVIVGMISLIAIAGYVGYQNKSYILNPQAEFRTEQSKLPPRKPSADWRFGVGLETWNYDKVKCFTDDPLFQPPNGHRESVVGQPISCPISYMQHLRQNINGMAMKNSQTVAGLHPNAMNVSEFTMLDPSANVQMIWFHYIIDPTVSTQFTKDELNDIYAHADIPGATVVKIKRASAESSPPGGTVPRDNKWYLDMPDPLHSITRVVINNKDYPVCTDCIYQADKFKQYLQDNINFNSVDLSNGQRGWYTFYLLAETELSWHPSHYLTPVEYAAILNQYVKTINAWFPNKHPSFILGSPTHLESTDYQQYYAQVYDLLLPEVKTSMNNNVSLMNGLDIFLGYSTPDTDHPDKNVKATTDEELQIQALDFNENIKRAGRFFYDLNKKPSVLTQTSILMPRVPHPPPDVDVFATDKKCSWCSDNEEVWKDAQYTAGRLGQLAYRQLKLNADQNHITAWSYWQGLREQYWYEPMADKSWGGLTAGVHWLASPDDCNSEADWGYRHDPPMFPTEHPYYKTGYFDCVKHLPNNTLKTTVLGDEYLSMANYNYVYRPANAPEWWPKEDQSSCYFRSTATFRDMNGGVINDPNFKYYYANYANEVQRGSVTFGKDQVLGDSAGYRNIVKDGHIVTTLADLPESFRGIRSSLTVHFPNPSNYVFDHWECEVYNFKTGQVQNCDKTANTGLTSLPNAPEQVTAPLNDTLNCNTTHFYTWYFKKK